MLFSYIHIPRSIHYLYVCVRGSREKSDRAGVGVLDGRSKSVVDDCSVGLGNAHTQRLVAWVGVRVDRDGFGGVS